MVVTVGSMQILCVLRDQGAIAALSVVKNKVVEVGSMVKNTTTEIGRMSAASGLLGKMLGLIGIGGFVGLLMAAPRTSAEITKLMNHLRQIALVMDKYVAPVVGWLADAIGWLADKFKDLPEPMQALITYGLLVAGSLGTLLVIARLLGLNSLAKWAWEAAAGFAGWAASLFGVSVPMLIVYGLVIALGAYLIDWVTRTSGFNEWLDSASSKGNEFASTINLILTPVRLFADIINIALGKATWDRFIEDIDRAKKSIEDMGGVVGTVIDLLGMMPGMGGLTVGNEARNYLLGTGSYASSGSSSGSEYYSVPQSFNGGKGPTVVNVTNNIGTVENKTDMDTDTIATITSNSIASKLSWLGF